ncbi:MAG: hypothetical protein HeimC3_20670 [Candidatus Heimdallarchaeota archaeon LC_3]|nr:MAG: hypothetical protein HeimC3_20670 [Candidatus Heimdallarchaeota archaeon LC_3]
MNFDIWSLMINVGIIYFSVGIGFFIRKVSSTNKKVIQKLFTTLLLYFIFPFLIITSILNAQFSTDLVEIIFVIIFSFVVMLSGVVIIWLYLRSKDIKSDQRATTILCTGFPNSIFLPFPIIILIIGEPGIIYATFFAIGFTMIYNTLGAWIAIKNSKKFDKKDQKYISNMVKKILFFPPTFFLLIGMLIKLVFKPKNTLSLLTWIPIDLFLISEIITFLSNLSLLLALIVVGLTFEMSFDSLKNINLLESSIVRLLIAPTIGLLTIFVGIYFGLSITRIIAIPIMIQAISGPAVANIAFADAFGLKTEIASTYITVITALSLIILVPVLSVLLILFPV